MVMYGNKVIDDSVRKLNNRKKPRAVWRYTILATGAKNILSSH